MGFVISTPQGDVALCIALGVLLLSVVLHPIVRACFHRIRSDRAWRSIENNEAVDVTKYSIFAEALGDRGKWDAARVIAIMLAAYNVATWGLELSLDLAVRTDGPVDLLNRPPPVFYATSNANLTEWTVLESQPAEDDAGSLANFEGTMSDGYATTTYRIAGKIVRGTSVSASWSDDSAKSPDTLFYDVGGDEATVTSVGCSVGVGYGTIVIRDERGASSAWGSAHECEAGPRLTNESRIDVDKSPPTVLLNSTDGENYLIVEEDSSYLGFLYSVWKTTSVTAEAAVIQHLFYVSSKTRLVEAIVTGIANGVETGGGCVDLMSQFSLENETYGVTEGARVSLFGEHPNWSEVKRMDDVESIVAGVMVNDIGAVCAFVLMAVTTTALAGCVCCLRRSQLDIYNRDDVIRAVSCPMGLDKDGKPAALKIFVAQESNDGFRMVVTDDGIYRGCAGVRKRLLRVLEPPTEAAPPPRGISRTWSFPTSSISARMSRPTSVDLEPTANLYAQEDDQQGQGTTFTQIAASPVPARGLVQGNSFVLRGTAMRSLEGTPFAPGDRGAALDVASPTEPALDLTMISEADGAAPGSGGRNGPIDRNRIAGGHANGEARAGIARATGAHEAGPTGGSPCEDAAVGEDLARISAGGALGRGRGVEACADSAKCASPICLQVPRLSAASTEDYHSGLEDG